MARSPRITDITPQDTLQRRLSQLESESKAAVSQAAGGIVSIAPGTIEAVHIATGTITAGKIEANSITAAQIAAGAIEASELAVDAVTATKIKAGEVIATKLAANSVTAEKIEAGSVSATKLAANSVTAEKIVAGEVTAIKLAVNSVTAEKIEANAVTATKIKAGEVTVTKLAANSVTAEKIEANAVTATKIEAKAITTAKLDAEAVTAEKIKASTITSNEIAANTIKAGDIEAIEITTAGILVGGVSAGTIASGAITSGKISISELSALSGNLGTITAGTVTGATLRTAASGKRVVMNSEGLKAFNASEALVLNFDIATGNLAIKGAVEAGSTVPATTVTGKLTNAQLEAIEAAKITGKITETQIGENAVSTVQLAANAVIAENILAGAVIAGKIATESITANEILAGTINTGRLAVGLGGVGPNLIVGGNAEMGAGVFTYMESGTKNGTFGVTASQFTDGEAAFEITSATVENMSGWGPMNAIPVTPGEVYTVRVKVKGAAAKAAGLYIRINEFKVKPAEGANSSGRISPPTDFKSNAAIPAEWTTYEFAYTAKAETKWVLPSIYNWGSGTTLYFDEFEFRSPLSLQSSVITPEQITTGMIRANTIQAGDIQALAITTAEIAAETIAATNIATNAVIARTIKTDAVEAAKIKADAVTAAKIEAGAVTAAKIETGAVTAEKISATAIDGKTITGAIIRTSSSEETVMNSEGFKVKGEGGAGPPTSSKRRINFINSEDTKTGGYIGMFGATNEKFGSIVYVTEATEQAQGTLRAVISGARETSIGVAQVTGSTSRVTAVADNEEVTIVEDGLKSSFLQLATLANRKIAWGEVTLKWTASTDSAVVEVTHGLGAEAKAVVLTRKELPAGSVMVQLGWENNGSTKIKIKGALSSSTTTEGKYTWVAIG